MTEEELQEFRELIEEYARRTGSIWEETTFINITCFVNAMLAKREVE